VHAFLHKHFKDHIKAVCPKYHDREKEKGGKGATQEKSFIDRMVRQVNRSLVLLGNDTLTGCILAVDKKPQGNKPVPAGMFSRDSFGHGKNRSGQVLARAQPGCAQRLHAAW
jgi:hypothetical protein